MDFSSYQNAHSQKFKKDSLVELAFEIRDLLKALVENTKKEPIKELKKEKKKVAKRTGHKRKVL